MLVRIQWRGPEDRNWAARIALAAGSFLAPVSLLAFTVSLWAFASEFQWTGPFPLTASLLGRWEVWLGLAALTSVVGQLLSRAGTGQGS